MPQLAVAAVGAIVSGVQIAAAAVGLTTTVAGSLALGSAVTTAIYSTAASIAASLLMPTPEVGGRTGSPTEWQADPNAPIPFIVGRLGTAGRIVYRNTYGPDNRYQGIVTVVSGAGPINAWSSFTLDDVAYSQTGDRLNHPKFNNWAWRQTRLGTQPDTALTSPAGVEGGGSGLPGWTSAHKLSGKAAFMLTLRQDADFKYYPTGEPRPISVVQGLKYWDPRLDSTYPGGSGSCRQNDPATWVYGQNPIIHGLKWALGYRENGKLVGGIGSSINGIDVAAFVEAANVADANGWTIGGCPTTADDKRQVLSAMLQAGGAAYVSKAGKISCVSRGTPRTSVVTISVADTAGPVQITTAAPRIGRINTVVPRCVQEDQKWEMVALEPVTAAAYVTEDNEVPRSRGIDYPYVTDADQCAQLAAYDIADSREGITGTIPLKPYLRELEPGDAFTITEAGFVLDGQKCLVLRRNFDPATNVVTVEFRSETDGKHDWALGRTGTPPPTPSLDPVDVTEFPAPEVGDWTAVAGIDQPSILVTGAATNSQTQNIIVEYRKVGATDWIVWTETSGTVQRVEITGLDALTAYEVAISYRSIWKALSDRLVLDAVTTGASTATVSEDTEAVGGVPSGVINDQIGVGAAEDERAALALVQAAAGRLKVQRLAEGLGFDAGERVGTKVRRETIERLTAQEAMVLDIEGLSAGLETANGLISGLSLDVTEIIVSLDGKVSITDFNLLEGRMDTAEGEIVATALDIVDIQLDVAGKASISSVDALDARLDTAEGTISAHTLDITAIELDVAGKASVESFELLEAEVGDQAATLLTYGSVLVDLEGKTEAYLQFYAAAGAEPAFAELLADADGSMLRLVAKELSFSTVSGGTIVNVLKLISDDAYFADRVYFGTGAYIDPVLSALVFDDGTTKTLYGQAFGASSDVQMWFGPSSVDNEDITRTNGSFVFGTDGEVYRGAAVLPEGGGLVPNTVTVSSVSISSTTPTTCATINLTGVVAGSTYRVTQGTTIAATANSTNAAGYAMTMTEQLTSGGTETTRGGGSQIAEEAPPTVWRWVTEDVVGTFTFLATMTGSVTLRLKWAKNGSGVATGSASGKFTVELI